MIRIIYHTFPALGLYRTDPAQHIILRIDRYGIYSIQQTVWSFFPTCELFPPAASCVMELEGISPFDHLQKKLNQYLTQLSLRTLSPA